MVGTARPVVIVGDPVLHAETAPVTEFDDELAALIDDLFVTMKVAEGVGLAANQIGVARSVFVYDCHDDDDVVHKGHVVNPRIVATLRARSRSWKKGACRCRGPTQPWAGRTR